MTELEKAVVALFNANEAFAAADTDEENETAGNALMEAEDAVLALGRALVEYISIRDAVGDAGKP